MQCIKCKSSETRVVESRDASDNQAIRRRRECLKKACHQRFTTYERIERSPLTVVKNNGTRERFNRDKLLDGLLKSTEKTKVSADEVEEALVRIEEYLYSQGTREVSSRYIGNQVMKELEALDPVAYVRFASVYKEFKDIKQFDAALQRIKKKSQKKA